ncbi:MAG TPA: uracil-DNA glycosylase family protein [Solirubrobacteraceae bacterium]|nr:uracil-DNA glycosylase family protein [Solirubrobacteraceae bacterium]
MSGAERERSPSERRELLKELLAQARACVRCNELASTRKTVVFGAGNADAELMFVGEAPGASEDEQGLPFVGRAGKLLDTLLEEVGLKRSDVFVANVLKCLRYDAPVQLADGSWERIGRLVRSRYDGAVMAVDADGQIVPRRVIGWHATPQASRRVYRLSYESAKRAGVHQVGIHLTGDHPVLTERGYVNVEELEPADRIATGQGLSALAFDVLCGTLLGDGCLQSRSSCLTFSHSGRQAEYAAFKAELLAELEPRYELREIAAAVGAERVDPVALVRTLAHGALATLRRDFYDALKRVPTWIAERLNPRMLAIWFMDDGYMRIRPRRRPSAEIARLSFDEEDLQVLLRGLMNLGLSAKALRGRLYFDVDASERLSELIAPYVPPSMRYKLHPEVADRVRYDPSRFSPGPPEVVYDRVVVEAVGERGHADSPYFCIDVEEVHNFVTAGGVVHNCRPPGNRDPLPIEIENCKGYLLRQVELIEPSVICTLGNFSTKLLRADPTGITRLHGQPEVIMLGSRAVRLYPIFHPAAALYTPRMLATLREDFARVPDLLALGPPPQPDLQEPLGPAAEDEDAPPLGGAGQAARALGADPAPGASSEPDQLGLF